ncbi:conserved Plasmodium protein, unknown function [Plasmodium relictum]|uniref:Uncharacterized protein n=1 Tax=Plasmodium relictum TaxID=85471 RepID=A0A1J1H947_PLARL|nr:conserved Plasmodium protein, unknown function [Plasmodium relictum]CRH01319.1 conserved Plasmodium protein, unknown function [Plasmodium relictum]
MIKENLYDKYLNLFIIDKGNCDFLYKDNIIVRNTKNMMRTKSINYQNLKDELKNINDLETFDCNTNCFASLYLSDLDKSMCENKQNSENKISKGDYKNIYSNEKIYLDSNENKQFSKIKDNNFENSTYNSKSSCEDGFCSKNTCSIIENFKNSTLNKKIKNIEMKKSYKNNKNIDNYSISDTERIKENTSNDNGENNNCEDIEDMIYFTKKNMKCSCLRDYSEENKMLQNNSFYSCDCYKSSKGILSDLNNFNFSFFNDKKNIHCNSIKNSNENSINLRSNNNKKDNIKKYVEVIKNSKKNYLKKKKKNYSNIQKGILNIKNMIYNDHSEINKDKCSHTNRSNSDNSSCDESEEIIDKINLNVYDSNNNNFDSKINEEWNRNKYNIKDILDKNVLSNFIETINNYSINNKDNFKGNAHEKLNNKKNYEVNNCKNEFYIEKEEKELNNYAKIKSYYKHDCNSNSKTNKNIKVNKMNLNGSKGGNKMHSNDNIKEHANNKFILNDDVTLSDEYNICNLISKNTYNENNKFSIINDFINAYMEKNCHDFYNNINDEIDKTKIEKVGAIEKNKNMGIIKEKLNKSIFFDNKNDNESTSKLNDSENGSLKNLNNDNNKIMIEIEKCKCHVLNNSNHQNKNDLSLNNYTSANCSEHKNLNNNLNKTDYLKDIPHIRDISKNLIENYEILNFYLNSLNKPNTTINDQLLNLYCYSYLRHYILNNIKLSNSYYTENTIPNNENNNEINKNKNESIFNNKKYFHNFNKEKKCCANSYFEKTHNDNFYNNNNNNNNNNTISNNINDNKKNILHDLYNTYFLLNNNSNNSSNFLNNSNKTKSSDTTEYFNKMNCNNISFNTNMTNNINEENTNSSSNINNIDSNLDNNEVKQILHKYFNYLKLKNYIIPSNIEYDSCITQNKNKNCGYNESSDFLNLSYNFINEHKNVNNNISYNNFCKFHKKELDKINDFFLNKSCQGTCNFDVRSLYENYVLNLNYRNIHSNKFFYFFKNIIERLNREELQQLMLCQCCYVFKKIENKITPLDIILDTQILFYDCLNYFKNEGWINKNVSEENKNIDNIKDKNLDEYSKNGKFKETNYYSDNLNCFGNSSISNSHTIGNSNILNKKNSNDDAFCSASNNQNINFYNLENHEISRTSTTATISYKSNGISKEQKNNQEFNQNNKKNNDIEINCIYDNKANYNKDKF